MACPEPRWWRRASRIAQKSATQIRSCAPTFAAHPTRLGILVIGGAAALLTPQSRAQTAASPETLPYVLMSVPPNGCVWAGAVFSDGAVIQGGLPISTFFRCRKGSWEAFGTAQQAIDASHPQQPSGSSRPPR